MAKQKQPKTATKEKSATKKKSTAKRKTAVRKQAAARKTAKPRIVRKKAPVKRKVARRRRTAAKGIGSLLKPLRAFQGNLISQRDDLDSRIQAVDQALGALGGGAAVKPAGVTRRRGGGPRKGSLKSFIERVLRGRVRPLAVKDITAAVLKAGYKTKNKTLDKSVGIALADMATVVKVARGTYRAR